MKKKVITCSHCGGMFEINWNHTTGVGSSPYNHTKGCHKVTRVQHRNGEIVGTKKG